MSFWWVFCITEWNYDGCWTRGEWIETGHSSRTFMFSTSISWTKPSSVHNPNLPKGNVFFRHHCERQHKTTKLFTVQYVGYMLLYAISRLAFLAVVQSCLPIRTRQGSWTKTMRWKNPRWSKPKFFLDEGLPKFVSTNLQYLWSFVDNSIMLLIAVMKSKHKRTYFFKN